MLTGQYLSWRHHRGLASSLDGDQHRQERDHRLAAPNVALQQTQHPGAVGQVAFHVRNCLTLPLRQLEGEAGEHPFAQTSVADQRATRLAPHGRAHQNQGKLIGQQFIIGKASAHRNRGRHPAELRRRVGAPQGLLPCRPAFPLDQRRIAPFGQLRGLFERGGNGLRHDLLGQPRGQRVNRLDPL